jgi:hypothetical protein
MFGGYPLCVRHQSAGSRRALRCRQNLQAASQGATVNRGHKGLSNEDCASPRPGCRGSSQVAAARGAPVKARVFQGSKLNVPVVNRTIINRPA